MFKSTIVLIVFLGVAACSNVPKTFSYTPESDQALAVFAAPQVGSMTIYTYGEVDLKEQTFTSRLDSFSFNGIGSGEFIGASNGAMFALKEFTPGDYAIVAFGQSGFNGVSEVGVGDCWDQGARVFRLEPGKISLVSLRGLTGNMSGEIATVNADTAEKGFNELRAEFPDIVGDVSYVEPTAEIEYEETKSTWTKTGCTTEGHVFNTK